MNSDVNISTANSNVTLDTNASINSLNMSGPFNPVTLTGDGQGRTLTIAGALTMNNANLTLYGDAVSSGTLSNTSSFIDLENGAHFSVSGAVMNNGVIEMDSINQNGSNVLNIGGTLTNTGAVLVGALTNSGGDMATIGGDLINSGGFSGEYETSVQITGSVTNSGMISTTAYGVGGQLFGDNHFYIGGDLTNNAGATIAVSGGLDGISITGNLSNSGSIYSGGGDPHFGSNFISVGGTFTNRTAQSSLYANGTQDNVTIGLDLVNHGTVGIMNGSTLYVGGNMNNSGTFTMQYICDFCPSPQLTVTGAVTNSGSMSILGPGDYVSFDSLNNSGSIDFGGQTVATISHDVTNSGQITTSGQSGGGNSLTINGKLTNNPGGVLALEGSSDMARIGTVLNAGTISVGNGAGLIVPVGTHATGNALSGFINAGTVGIAQNGLINSPLGYTQTVGKTTVDGSLSATGGRGVSFAGGSVFGNGGTVTGPMTSNASINMGDALMTVGQMAFHGNYTQGANGSLTFDIASLTQFDKLNVSGNATLNGTMNVDLLNGYTPQVGNTFDIMSFASRAGTFSTVVGLPINSQEHFVLEYNSTNLTLDVVAGQGSGLTSLSAGSSNSEPFITQLDGSGNSLLASSGTPGATTPEPGSILLFGSGLAGLAGWLRLKRTI